MGESLEQLKESDSLEHYYGRANYRLFTTDSGIFPFVKYEEQLAEINDYCCYLLECMKNKVCEFQSYDRDIDYYDTPESWEYSKFLSWDFLYRDINKCTLLLLLLAFFESTLNEIANWFSEITGQASEWKKIRNPKVSDYIRQIGSCCKTDLKNTLTNELIYYDSIRKIRNKFVHNEWGQIPDRYKKFILADVIDMISRVVAEVERSAMEAKLIG